MALCTQDCCRSVCRDTPPFQPRIGTTLEGSDSNYSSPLGLQKCHTCIHPRIRKEGIVDQLVLGSQGGIPQGYPVGMWNLDNRGLDAWCSPQCQSQSCTTYSPYFSEAQHQRVEALHGHHLLQQAWTPYPWNPLAAHLLAPHSYLQLVYQQGCRK